jgi:hypothetical protein
MAKKVMNLRLSAAMVDLEKLLEAITARDTNPPIQNQDIGSSIISVRSSYKYF